MKKLTLKILFILFSAVLIYSCSKNDASVTPGGGLADTSTNFKYPFSLNSNWLFTTTPSYRYNPDSLQAFLIRNNVDLDSAIETGYTYWKNDTIINGVNARVLRGNHTSTAHSYNTTEYYIQTDTGLVNTGFIISKGTSFGPFRPNLNVKILYNGEVINSLDEISTGSISGFSYTALADTTYLNSIKYPIVTNFEWFFRKTSALQTQRKKYLSYEQVTTPAGAFNCIKIQRKNYKGNPEILDSTFTSFDYFSKAGLVKRKTINVLEFRNSSDVIIGYLEIHRDVILNSVNIAP